MQKWSDDNGDADGDQAASSASSAEAGDVLAPPGYEFKMFTFEEGPLGMKFGGTLEHTTAGVEVAIVTVS